MRSLLVTGAAGFIGANFVHYWIAHHPEDAIVALDALTYAGNRENLAPAMTHPRFRFVHGDIRNRALVTSLLKEAHIDTIVHFAAESHVDRSISGPGAFIETNVVGTYELLEAARAVWLGTPGIQHRFHHVSTDEVYGSLGPEDPPFTEETRYDPQSPYAASKAASDHLVRAYGNTYGLRYTISNCSNNYGPYQFPEKLIPLCITNLLDGIALPVYGDGQNVRDWLHVEDHCRGIELILERGHEGQTYNIGGNCQRTNVDLVRNLCAVMDAARPDSAHYPHHRLIRFVMDRPGHDRRYAIDASKLDQHLGYTTRHAIESGLAATVRWYIDHESWWRPLIARSALPAAAPE
ncbi:MAG: dTDP-glucose 4,6-dehydratase [Acidiferrobacteraceae bacterium]